MRPYTRSLHPADYQFLSHAEPLRRFQREMQKDGIPHREWHEHRLWEYASIIRQLDGLGISRVARLLDAGSGASFFPPYLGARLGYENLFLTDSMVYGDITPSIKAQRQHYGLSLPLYDVALETMPLDWTDHFDVTMCISTIEHANDHDSAMKELVRVTKPLGYIFITSDYFRSVYHWEQSTSRHLQITPYTQQYVLQLPRRFGLAFVGSTDLDYKGDFVQNYSFVNLCLQKVVC